MPRKLLTANQTDIVRCIRAEIRDRIGREITLTDVLISISNKYMIDSISMKIKASYDAKIKEQETLSMRKDYCVYQGEVLSNDLKYRAIIAAKNKQEIQTLLIIDEREAKKWVKSTCPSHLDITLTSPGTFFGTMLTARGRPSIGQYIKLTNVKPVKGI